MNKLCQECGTEEKDPNQDSGYCSNCRRPICERKYCNKPSNGKTIYGLGYLASVCDGHYAEASNKDKEDAVRFRYAE